ncbi:MAG: ABC transporter permease [Chloroflexota bacterium]|jgi:ABC-2 type transport system permease protein
MSAQQMHAGRLRLTTLVARREYLRTVRRRGYLFGTILLPVGIALLMAVSVFFSTSGFDGDGTASGTIVVVNESDVPIPEFSTQTASLELLEDAEAETRLKSGAIGDYYVIPEDFRESGAVTRIETGSGFDISRLEGAEANEALLSYVIRDTLLREIGVAPEDAARILRGVSITVVTVEGDEVSGADIAADIALPMVFVAIFMISIFMTSGYLLQSVTEEKENRVVEIVLSSVPATPLMAGKIIGLGGAGLTQVAIWVLSAIVAIPLLSSQIPDLGPISLDTTMLVLALTYFVLGYLAYGAIFAAVGAIAPGNREAQQYSGFLGFAAALPFIVFSIFLSDLQSPVVLALALFPLTTPTAMLIVLGVSDGIPWELVGASLTSLTLFALLATWASARIFRATVLLYGVRPSLQQLIGAVRSTR